MIDFGNFLVQILPIAIIYLLLPLILLVAYFLYLRPMMKKRRAAKNPEPTTNALAELAQVRGKAPASPDDLPDLDLLLASAPTPAAAVRAPQPGTQYVRLNNGDLVPAREVLVVLRDEVEGRLLVQVGDKAYRSLHNGGEAKTQFTRVMKELSANIMQPDDAASAPPPAQVTSDKPAQAAPPAAAPAASVPQEKQEKQEKPEPAKRRTTSMPAVDGPLPGDLPSYRYDDVEVRIQKGSFGRTRFDMDAPPVVDIASAIESYLQYKLQHTPEYAGRNIHIMPSPSGGVRILVDGTTFEAVDEVSDEEVRDFLRETIEEWQSRQ